MKQSEITNADEQLEPTQETHSQEMKEVLEKEIPRKGSKGSRRSKSSNNSKQDKNAIYNEHNSLLEQLMSKH